MVSWSDGYNTEVGYTHGYYRELSPAILDYALLLKGLARPEGGRLRYLELGYGQGLSLNIHAAACPGEYWGTDFMPEQAVNAASLAQAAGSDVRVLNDGFDELLRRDDLPEFDVIGIHGIWSWISPEARRDLIAVVTRKLAAGGVVYISYNCFPGWSAAHPIQHLMALFASANGGLEIGKRVDGALAFLEEVAGAGARFFAANPGVVDRVKDIRTKDRRYVVHEYFNQYWHCSTFAEMAGLLDGARASYAGSAHFLDHVDGAQITPAAQQILAKLDDPILRETTRDYFVNQQFRRDVFGKGLRRLSSAEQQARLADLRFVLTTPAEDVKYEIVGGVGKVALKPEIYQPIVERLRDAGGEPLRLGDIARGRGVEGLQAAQVIEATLVLSATGAIAPAQAPAVVDAARDSCRSLNEAIVKRALVDDDVQFLASPVLGTGLPVGRIFRMFIGARREGIADDEEMIRVIGQRVQRQDPFRAESASSELASNLRESIVKDLDAFRRREALWSSLGIV